MSELFNELKRRNVIRVAIAYAVVGWLIIEVIDTIAPRMAMPEWVPGFFIILVLVGFPIALLFSWAFEMTPQGLKKTHEVDADDSITHSTGRKLDFVIIAALVVALGYFVWDKFGTGPASQEVTAEALREDVRSIAVLPFADMSPEGDQEYFSDGISEELLNVLAKVPGLRVAARTSSFQFKGENRDVAEIAKQLRVAHIIEGSVRKSGTTLRITAQLIDAEEGFHIWSETYDRELTDIFAIQDEIAEAIVEALVERLGLTAAVVPKVQAAVKTTANLEAYNLYLLGRYQFEKRQQEPLYQALANFRKAIEIDPDYAPAYAGLADTYQFLVDDHYGDIPMAEANAKALPFIEKALALDPDLPEAHASLGHLKMHQNEFEIAEVAFLRAIELNPNFANAYNWRSINLKIAGRFRDSLKVLLQALEVDPLSEVLNFNTVFSLIYEARYAEADQAVQRIFAVNPTSIRGYIVGSYLAYTRGNLARAVEILEESIAEYPKFGFLKRRAARVYLTLGEIEKAAALTSDADDQVLLAQGRFEEAVSVAKAASEAAPDNEGARMRLAQAYLWAGRNDAALALFEALASVDSSTSGSLFNDSWDRLPAVELAYLRQQTGKDAEAAELLATIDSFAGGLAGEDIKSPDFLYLTSRLAAISGQKQKSLDALKLAVNGGWRSWFTATDPLFESLRGEARFDAILKVIAAETEGQRAMLSQPPEESIPKDGE